MSNIPPPAATIKPRERDAVLQALQAGLTPKVGAHLIQVGRKAEVESILRDIQRIKDGGASFRFVIGRFGSGKTYFLSLGRAVALQNRLVVTSADISMERRLFASNGEARALFSEIMRNLAVKTKPEGGALRQITEGWINKIHHEETSAGGGPDAVKKRIHHDLRSLQDSVGGFEFAEVLAKYYQGFADGNESLQANALRWLRAEYSTKTEARQDLGVRTIISDSNFYDSLKLVAAFVRIAGFAGLLVQLDEMVVLSHRLPSKRAREGNYEAILTMLNDCYQGTAEGIGFLLAGTDEFLTDTRRGLYSYEALRSRLSTPKLAGTELVDLSGPVINLPNLTAEDLFVLLSNIATVHASGDRSKWVVNDEAIGAVLANANEALGADFFKTPRDVIRSFVTLLNLIDQYPGKTWSDFVNKGLVHRREGAMSAEESLAQGETAVADDDDLEAFQLKT